MISVKVTDPQIVKDIDKLPIKKIKHKVKVGANVFFYTTDQFKEVEIPIKFPNGYVYVQKVKMPVGEPVAKVHNQVTLQYLQALAQFFASPCSLFPNNNAPPIEIILFDSNNNVVAQLNAIVTITFPSSSSNKTVILLTYIGIDTSNSTYTATSGQLYGGFSRAFCSNGIAVVGYSNPIQIAQASGFSVTKQANSPLTVIWQVQIQLSWTDPLVQTWAGTLMGNNTLQLGFSYGHPPLFFINTNGCTSTYSCLGNNLKACSPNIWTSFFYTSGSSAYAVFYILNNNSNGGSKELYDIGWEFQGVYIGTTQILGCGGMVIVPPTYNTPSNSLVMTVFVIVEFTSA